MGIVPLRHFHDGLIKGCATLKQGTKNNSQKHEVAKVQNIDMLQPWRSLNLNFLKFVLSLSL